MSVTNSVGIFKKLITDEDPFHIHKSMGIYCLCNFIIQLTFYLLYRKMYLSPIVMVPHILLHITSFVFKVLAKRPVTQDNKIISKCQCLFGKSYVYIHLFSV